MAVHSARAFPIQGGRVGDGTGVDKGTIPYWLAVLVYNQMVKAAIEAGHLDVPTLDQIEKAGGFLPLPFLDLLAGGNGAGIMAAQIYQRKTTLLYEEMPLHKIGITGRKVNGA